MAAAPPRGEAACRHRCSLCKKPWTTVRNRQRQRGTEGSPRQHLYENEASGAGVMTLELKCVYYRRQAHCCCSGPSRCGWLPRRNGCWCSGRQRKYGAAVKAAGLDTEAPAAATAAGSVSFSFKPTQNCSSGPARAAAGEEATAAWVAPAGGQAQTF